MVEFWINSLWISHAKNGKIAAKIQWKFELTVFE